MRDNPGMARKPGCVFRRRARLCRLFLYSDHSGAGGISRLCMCRRSTLRQWSGSASLFKVSAVTALMLIGLFCFARRQSGIRAVAFQVAQTLVARSGPARRLGEPRARCVFCWRTLAFRCCFACRFWSGPGPSRARRRSNIDADISAFAVLRVDLRRLGIGNVWRSGSAASKAVRFSSAVFSSAWSFSRRYFTCRSIRWPSLLALLSRQELPPLVLFGLAVVREQRFI